VMEREVFLLGGARGPVRRWPLPDFFDGLETAELHSTVVPQPRSFSPRVERHQDALLIWSRFLA
jgi:hypothetical protein